MKIKVIVYNNKNEIEEWREFVIDSSHKQLYDYYKIFILLRVAYDLKGKLEITFPKRG